MQRQRMFEESAKSGQRLQVVFVLAAFPLKMRPGLSWGLLRGQWATKWVHFLERSLLQVPSRSGSKQGSSRVN